MNLNENNSRDLVGVAASFLALTSISVTLRTYVRVILTKNFQLDDLLMLIAQAIFITTCVFILLGVRVGLGKHNMALSHSNNVAATMYQALAAATYILNMMFIKLSYAIFLLRLVIERRYRWTLWGSTAVVTIWSIVLFFWDIFQCSPVQAQWDLTMPGSHCVNPQQIVDAAYSFSAMTIATDWLYALLPIPLVWNVQMTKQAKMTVVVLLGLGIFASVATIIRIRYLSDITDTEDFAFRGTNVMIWTLIEPGVAITAASLVTIRPLLRAMNIKGFRSQDSEELRNRPPQRTPRHFLSRVRSLPGSHHDDITLIDMPTFAHEREMPSVPPPKQGDSASSTSTCRCRSRG